MTIKKSYNITYKTTEKYYLTVNNDGQKYYSVQQNTKRNKVL